MQKRERKMKNQEESKKEIQIAKRQKKRRFCYTVLLTNVKNRFVFPKSLFEDVKGPL